jgi:hypothetical protein
MLVNKSVSKYISTSPNFMPPHVVSSLSFSWLKSSWDIYGCTVGQFCLPADCTVPHAGQNCSLETVWKLAVFLKDHQNAEYHRHPTTERPHSPVKPRLFGVEWASIVPPRAYNQHFPNSNKNPVLYRTVWWQTYPRSVARHLSRWLMRYFEQSVPVLALLNVLEYFMLSTFIL